MISQNYPGVQSINIRSSANVTIHKGDTLQVKITGDDAAKVKVNQSGVELAIEYAGVVSNNGSQSILNNMRVGGNVTIGGISQNNTIVTVSGVRADDSKVEIEIWCPDGLAIDCTLDGIAILNAAPLFDLARITLADSSNVKLTSFSAKIYASGSATVDYVSLKGYLKIQVSDSGNIVACGEFINIEASASGFGNIQTSGLVARDYDADISEMGKLIHEGEILGRKRKSISGLGSVIW